MRWMLAMLVFIPISIGLRLAHYDGIWLFVTAALAIAPLAGFLGTATSELSKYRGPAVGGLLNATVGNATEMIIALIAVRNGEIQIVKASLIGSIIGNVLLVLGLSLFLGGIKHKIQVFNQDVAQNHATMLALAAISLLIPALFVRASGVSEGANNPQVAHLSFGVAAVLIIVYIASLFFSLRTHEAMFNSGTEDEPKEWKQWVAGSVLLGSALVIALESEFLVQGFGTAVQSWHVSKLFLGVILVPILGNAAEHTSAVMMALKNKVDVSLNIVVSSSTQIAMFVAPLVIFAGPLLGHPVTILFSTFELIALTAAIAIAVFISLDGKSHWMEGAQLLATYAIVALAFYYIPT